jgi:ankyrin repeat protein
MLSGITKKERKRAHRIFQCVAVSSRPLCVEELADVLTFDFDAETSDIPNFDSSRRPPDPKEAIRSTCSSLITINDVEGKNIVQFSHLSVREYLTSTRIAKSAHGAHFHILPKSAHTLLAKACLAFLLQLDHNTYVAKIQNFPLIWYAVEHWLDHARFEDVSLDIRDMMDRLFDRAKEHWAVWNGLYDVERSRRCNNPSLRLAPPEAVPLYYATLCGFRDLAERLIAAYPQDIKTRGGYYKTPLHAALAKELPEFALFLLDCGSDLDVDSLGRDSQTALYKASSRGYTNVVRSLVDRGAKIDAEGDDWNEKGDDVRRTPLHVASGNGRLEVVRLLLEHRANVNYQDNDGKSALHLASRHPSSDVARLLLDRGANINASSTRGKTALHEASEFGQVAAVELFLERGVNVNVQTKSGRTPLHYAAKKGRLGVSRLLINRHAEVNVQDKEDFLTPLHLAAANGHLVAVELLLRRRADPRARTVDGKTPFELASQENHMEVMRLLSEHTGEGMDDSETRDLPYGARFS